MKQNPVFFVLYIVRSSESPFREVIAIKFEKIYSEQAKMVFSYLLSLCGNYHVAEDLTQETFLRAYQHRNSYDESRKLSTWLCEIAKNLYIDYTRTKINQEIPDDSLTTEPDVNIEQEVLGKELIKMIHSLKEPYKEVFLLKYSMGLSYSEIGEIFGQKEGWARLVYYRARVTLREMLTGRKR